MPNSPTANAPKDYDELVKLLENDTKVKVAGESRASASSTGQRKSIAHR